MLVEVPDGTKPRPAPPHVRRGADARRVVIAGSGTTAAACAFAFAPREHRPKGEVEMFSPEASLPYDRTLPSKAVLAGAEAARPLMTIPRDALDLRDIVLSHGGDRAFDMLLVAIGGEAQHLDLPSTKFPGVYVLRSRA